MVTEVKSAWSGEIPLSETKGTPLNLYNASHPFAIDHADVKVVRIFVLHNFHDGYIWAWYSAMTYQANGESAGSSRAYTKWKIHKENAEWEIVEVFEAP